MTDKVDRLAREEEALASKLKRLREARLQEEKKLRSRRAEVVGNLILKRVSEGELEASWLETLLSEGLTRKTDRTLFELDQVTEDESVQETDLEASSSGLEDDESSSDDDVDELESLAEVEAPALAER